MDLGYVDNGEKNVVLSLNVKHTVCVRGVRAFGKLPTTRSGFVTKS